MDGWDDRDRIVMLGRRSAGKTIFLASLYQQLWRSQGELSMKACSGRCHQALMNTCETLRAGTWPYATGRSELSQMEVELRYRGRRRLMVVLDYAGELFRDVFVQDRLDSPEAAVLLTHLSRAAVLFILVDPSVAVGRDQQAYADDDFGMVQAVQHLQSQPGGREVPVVLLLTKLDQNYPLFRGTGATQRFVARHYPALVRTCPNLRIYHTSAVQVVRFRNGRTRPRGDSRPVNSVEPLRYCLDLLERRRQMARSEAVEQKDAGAVNHTQFLSMIWSGVLLALAALSWVVMAL